MDLDHYHDNNIKDCGTTHFVIYNVNSQEKLNMIIGRHYYNLGPDNKKISDELHTVTPQSTDLIGKKIGLRSPVTCCGKHVCATCYGRELSEINKDVNTGLTGEFKLTEPLTQRLLSAKHLLSTNTDEVEWTGENADKFAETFNINMDYAYFQNDIDTTISIPKPDKENDYDDENEMYIIREIDFHVQGSKQVFKYQLPVKCFINPQLFNEETNSEEDDITINSTKYGTDKWIFQFEVKNKELTRSLQQIIDLIERNDHLGITDYSEFVNKFDDLLIDNGLGYINSVHIEMISSNLIRDKATGKRLDFSKAKLDDYEIIRVSTADMRSPLATSLAFERINNQLVDSETYDKDDESMYDCLYE